MKRPKHHHAEYGIRAFPSKHCTSPAAHCRSNRCRSLLKGIHETNRTKSCCAMTFRRERFSKDIAMTPAIAPANTACHRRVFLRTQFWCTCADEDSRASRLSRGDMCDCALRGGDGAGDEGGELSRTKSSLSCSSCSSWVEKRPAYKFRKLSCSVRLAGNRTGSAFRMTRYNATKLPINAIKD